MDKKETISNMAKYPTLMVKFLYSPEMEIASNVEVYAHRVGTHPCVMESEELYSQFVPYIYELRDVEHLEGMSVSKIDDEANNIENAIKKSGKAGIFEVRFHMSISMGHDAFMVTRVVVDGDDFDVDFPEGMEDVANDTCDD